jgi:hypothetical protein
MLRPKVRFAPSFPRAAAGYGVADALTPDMLLAEAAWLRRLAFGAKRPDGNRTRD